MITFNNVVEEVVPLTEVYKFQPLEFEAKAGTYLGKAIRFLSAKAEMDVVKTSNETKGDWKPLVFIMTDGKSGDKIKKAIKDFNRSQFGNILICATGKQPNIEDLRLISENVMMMENVTKEQILSFFKWVTASVSTCSQIIEELGVEVKSIDELPPPPPEVNVLV